jgi:hypothetical protein
MRIVVEMRQGSSQVYAPCAQLSSVRPIRESCVQVVHPYLQRHLQNVVLVEPALQQGRKSPSLAAAPGTPVTDHPETERPRAVVPSGPSTPATYEVQPSNECAQPPEEKGTEKQAKQENAADCGNDALDGRAQQSQPGTREPSVDCSSMAYSMDYSIGVHFRLPATTLPCTHMSCLQRISHTMSVHSC